jgi:hypothetical protein
MQVVDFNSLAASRVKTIQTDVNEDVYPYLVGVQCYSNDVLYQVLAKLTGF